MLRTTLLVITLALAACTNTVVAPVAKPPLPAELVAHCPDLDKLSGGTAADVLNNIVNNSAKYYQCRAKDDALIQAIQ